MIAASPPLIIRRLAALCVLLAASPSVGEAVALSVLQGWGEAVATEIDSSLRVPGTNLYAETASLGGGQSGGINGRSFVWPASTQFRVLNSLLQSEPNASTTVLRQFSNELRRSYWDDGYRSGAGAGDRFYDDNAHIAVALVEAYNLTDDPVYLARAIDTYKFVLEGEDTAAGGGIYFKQFDFSSKDAISTLQGARSAAMLFRATGEAAYLADATRLLEWANSHIQLSNGLFNQGYLIAEGTPSGVEIVNSAGVGISANLELYAATSEAGYLSEAQRIATASLGRYFDSATGRINDEGYWAYELVDALNDLYLTDKDPRWRTAVHGALAWLNANKQDPNTHYDLFWGRNGPIVDTLSEWNLNEQASVARAYLDTALTMLTGDANLDGLLTAADVRTFVSVWQSDTSGHDTLGRLRRGDFNLDGLTDVQDSYAFQEAMDEAGVEITPAQLAAIGLLLPGDYNDDGLVDAADYSVWRDSLGGPAGSLPNDLDGGVIGQNQYSTWRENYGAAGASSAAATRTPEPTAVACLLTAAGLTTRRRPRAA
ncbi:Glycosyl hydrolase family 76 [Posidoniimonas corsicana]|uniref:Glycosyl hydrolase family 76 n=2 Tax=Posidoniimonas corsicana TaxID=1938618 RepID=A0A5C5VEG8_9BACT|nr:Glycosyl hydrolase family 76 [Posidoniimonas corsicana]